MLTWVGLQAPMMLARVELCMRMPAQQSITYVAQLQISHCPAVGHAPVRDPWSKLLKIYLLVKFCRNNLLRFTSPAPKENTVSLFAVWLMSAHTLIFIKVLKGTQAKQHVFLEHNSLPNLVPPDVLRPDIQYDWRTPNWEKGFLIFSARSWNSSHLFQKLLPWPRFLSIFFSKKEFSLKWDATDYVPATHLTWVRS